MPTISELADARPPCLVDQVYAHHGVGVEEAARVLPVGPDATHNGRRVDDVVGVSILQGRTYAFGFGQVVVRGPDDDRAGPALLEPIDDPAAEEPSSPGDHDARPGQIDPLHPHGSSFVCRRPIHVRHCHDRVLPRHGSA